MEKEKKEYVAPEVKIVELKCQNVLLGYSGGLGYAPHEQNPIA